MQTLHSANEPRVQAGNKANLANVNISILDDETLDAAIVPSERYERRSTSAWQAKVDAAPDPRIAYHAIIEEWRTGCYDADIAVRWLQAYRLLTDPYTGDPYDLMSRASKAEFPDRPLPERVSAPIPPDYPNQDLIAALAPARQGRGA